jgi:glutamate/tyrosine decarboxylase-like PLP-dependent enzyme
MKSLVLEAQTFIERQRKRPVATPIDPETIRDKLASYDFSRPMDVDALIEDIIQMSDEWTMHSTSPRYFGLFNPPSLPITVAADALVALYNPQVGTWGHAPFADEAERHVLNFLGRLIGYPESDSTTFGAHFTSGGQEANSTALGAALIHRFPEIASGGIRALAAQPTIYLSAHAHHSFFKACKTTGIGTDSIREIEVDSTGVMKPEALEAAIQSDIERGHSPTFAVATLGTTGMGAIDPVADVVRMCRAHGLWCHADAAWGGSVLLSERWSNLLDGIASTDSVTWDAHKWLSVPMGAGMFFTRHQDAVEQLYSLHTGYVPSPRFDVVEPYITTAQWSRRFIGLKLFMALAAQGRSGYARSIEHQIEMGRLLRESLAEAGWSLVNDTSLPIACFRDSRLDGEALVRVVDDIERSGEAWLSTLQLPGDDRVLRACVTSFDTQLDDIVHLVEVLDAARTRVLR